MTFDDFSQLALYWQQDEPSVDVAPAPFGNGRISFEDLAFLIECWLTGTAIPPLPEQASNPIPSDGASYIDVNTNLSWTAGTDATSHDVYFGTSEPLPYIGNQTATTFEPGTLAEATTYYWRIDSVNEWGKTFGQVWRFLTFVPPPPPP